MKALTWKDMLDLDWAIERVLLDAAGDGELIAVLICAPSGGDDR